MLVRVALLCLVVVFPWKCFWKSGLSLSLSPQPSYGFYKHSVRFFFFRIFLVNTGVWPSSVCWNSASRAQSAAAAALSSGLSLSCQTFHHHHYAGDSGATLFLFLILEDLLLSSFVSLSNAWGSIRPGYMMVCVRMCVHITYWCV